MTREQQILSLLTQFKELSLDQQIDYDKFYLYSLVTHFKTIKGSIVTEIEDQLLFDEGIIAKDRSMAWLLMNLDLKAAYEQSMELASLAMTNISVLNTGLSLKSQFITIYIVFLISNTYF